MALRRASLLLVSAWAAPPEALLSDSGPSGLFFLQHTASRSPGAWRFLHAYPRQYLARKLHCKQEILIDGDIGDEAWQEVPFASGDFQDIAQPLFPGYRVPEGYSTKVKVRWDKRHLYVAAELGEPWTESGFVWGSNPTLRSSNPIANSNVPYYDNDFEVFVDVSGTNYFYKEFEMNFNNATYDVLWRSPDGGLGSVGVPCENGKERWCQNSSWPAFGGSWSMWPKLRSATKRLEKGWSLEVAFPLHATQGAGGLLSGGEDWERFDPNEGRKYWSVDFSRAEHPFFTSDASLFAKLCPKIKESDPTLLGADQWSCYWEWAWQSLGGHRYMHNPENFAFLQFTKSKEEEPCGNVEWPARYVLAQVYQAQIAYVVKKGSYASELSALLESAYCSLENGCNSTDLKAVATELKDVFRLQLSVENSATRCVKYGEKASYTGGPCFRASVDMELPGLGVQVKGAIEENRYLAVSAESAQGGELPCLPLS